MPTPPKPNLADLRQDYKAGGLLESDADGDPIRQFQAWFEQAQEAELPEPNAMTLATVSRDGHPDARIVLLKGIDERGFVFFTNYQSRKGDELAHCPYAALVFYWHELERQVRVEGHVERVSDAESDAYHQSRPRGSQIGAWTSEQSRVIADRAALEAHQAEQEARFDGKDVPRPPHWGGFRVIPDVIEFWQGRSNRLHDRLRYRREQFDWTRKRLSP